MPKNKQRLKENDIPCNPPRDQKGQEEIRGKVGWEHGLVREGGGGGQGGREGMSKKVCSQKKSMQQ